MTDVALIGLGGANGIVAHVLTAAGLDVVALEAGPRLEGGMMSTDEIRNDLRAWLAEPKAAAEVPTWRSDATVEAGPSPWPMLMVNAVGGSTVHYPGLSARLPPWSFAARSGVTDRYGPGAIPAGSTLEDWPLGYDDLEPHYDAVEWAIGVSGAPENPHAGPRGRDYPLPPLRRTGWTELMATAADDLGWDPFPAPAAINSASYNGNPECTYCGYCTNNGCYRDAKGSTDTNVIPWAEATGRLRVETEARVVRIEVDGDGRASGVTYVKEGRERFQPARVVILGCFTYENVRLLLLSTSAAHPGGLANGSGQVGRHYIAHVTPFAHGLFEGRDLGLFNGLWAQATCVDNWNADNFDHAGLGFVGGGLCTASQEAKPIASARTVPPGTPRWGGEWKRWLRAHARSVGTLNAQFDTLSYEDNVLDLDPSVTDRLGLPVIRVTFRPGENERRGYEFLYEKLCAWLRAAGAGEVWGPAEPVIEPRHAYGGTRMGDDPATSVVDRFGFAHEVPNLAITGASTFPTAGGVNPTLTLQALAWRTADRLVADWSRIAG